VRSCSLDGRREKRSQIFTTSENFSPKGINYRKNPPNIGCLVAAGVDCCVLANNHVLDWGEAGILETFDTLERAGIGCAGGVSRDH